MFFATCPKGLEYLLRDELVALGADDVREALAGVHFGGGIAAAYRACLWSRLASRVLMPLAEFDAPNEDALYDGVQSVDWSQHLAVTDTLAVDAVSNASTLTHTRYLAQKAKDAVVDQFRMRDGERPSVDTSQPSIRINLLLRKNRALLSLDLSGTPLHRRGWRIGQGEAPIKENLACAMLIRAGWPTIFEAGGAIVDPMCGAGTLLIEAALMAADVAPGLRRDYWGFSGWLRHDPALWNGLINDAKARGDAGIAKQTPRYFGYDADLRVISQAQRNVESAGLAELIQLAHQPLAQLGRPAECAAPGLIICNPPYGERIGRQDELAPLYRSLGERARAEFDGWTLALITSDEALAHSVGLRSEKRYTLFNGALECRFYRYGIGGESAPRVREEKPLSDGAQAVANRIHKTARHHRKRIEREGITAWRVYDADLPEYSAAIDIYFAVPVERPDSDPQTWLHIQEYAPPKDIPEHIASARLAELVQGACAALEVPRQRVVVKTRSRGKGGSKYGRMDERGEFLIVVEGGQRLLVNLHDYLDTGLFLDHRPLRLRLQTLARGARFLNLFAYTATASAHAAAGGAISTTSVDLSGTYLDWAGRNLALNGHGDDRNTLLQADALEWLEHERDEYDVIFVDPPTFSNSKRAQDFDVQRDHVALLQLCGERLSDQGLILFSNNNRRFKLNRDALPQFDIADISASTIGFDFERNPRIHVCYELRHA